MKRVFFGMMVAMLVVSGGVQPVSVFAGGQSEDTRGYTQSMGATQSVTDRAFEQKLDLYYVQRNRGIRATRWGVIGVLSGFVLASTALTLEGAGVIEPPVSTIATVGTYAIVGGSAGASAWGFWRWRTASDDYLETLRLQTRYYNITD